MPKQICAFTHHHNSEKSPWRSFVESEADALSQALEQEFGYDLSIEECEEFLKKVRVSRGESFYVADEDQSFFCWYEYEPTGSSSGTPSLNFGIGQGKTLAETDKYENVWLSLEEFKLDEKRKAELSVLDKDALINTILELEALR
jgi:hypothetical protein